MALAKARLAKELAEKKKKAALGASVNLKIIRGGDTVNFPQKGDSCAMYVPYI